MNFRFFPKVCKKFRIENMYVALSKLNFLRFTFQFRNICRFACGTYLVVSLLVSQLHQIFSSFCYCCCSVVSKKLLFRFLQSSSKQIPEFHPCFFFYFLKQIKLFYEKTMNNKHLRLIHSEDLFMLKFYFQVLSETHKYKNK